MCGILLRMMELINSINFVSIRVFLMDQTFDLATSITKVVKLLCAHPIIMWKYDSLCWLLFSLFFFYWINVADCIDLSF